MRWPFMLRARHDAIVARHEERELRLERERDHAKGEREYWQRRAELFIDRASARTGVSHEPVMRDTPVPGLDPFASHPFAGIGIGEFDSTKHS
jgi:hypothetical protein